MTPANVPGNAPRKAALVIELLLLHVFLALPASTMESDTLDEVAHLPTGYLYWEHSGEKVYPEAGIFAQACAALPLLFGHLSFLQGKGMPPTNMRQWEPGLPATSSICANRTLFFLQNRLSSE